MQQVLVCERFVLLHKVHRLGVCIFDMVDPVYASISQFHWNLPVKLILRNPLRSKSLSIIHETRWVPEIQNVPFQILVHYLKAARCDPSVMDPQINEEVFRTAIRSCEKIEEGFMVDLWCVFLEHDD
jgi:hypothetical protein